MRLFLVRHASPRVDPHTDPASWPLSARGREEARALAGIAARRGIEAIYTSSERKAADTALAIAATTGVPLWQAAGLEELRVAGWVANADAFNELVRAIFADPGASVRAAESAAAAVRRFGGVIDALVSKHQTAVVVSHGRILSAWLAAAGAVDDAFSVWRAMPLPAWAEVDIDARTITLAQPFAGVPLPSHARTHCR